MTVEFVSQIRNRIWWWRSDGRDDERLHGVWVPDPRDENFPYVASQLFTTGTRWTVTRASDGRHDEPSEYRVTTGGQLLTRHEGTVSATAYWFNEDGSLVLGGIRRLKVSDPDAREWPPGVPLPTASARPGHRARSKRVRVAR